MFGWITRFFSQPEPLVLENPVVEKTTKKKAAPKKKAAVDLNSMKKDELLAHAKKVGAKANSSMKKNDIIAAINAG